MLKDLKFGAKISVIIFFMMLLAVSLMGFLGYRLSKKTTQEQFSRTIETHNELKAEQINALVNNQKNWLTTIANSVQNKLNETDSLPSMGKIQQILPKYTFTHLYLVDAEGIVLASDEAAAVNQFIEDPTGVILSNIDAPSLISPAYKKGKVTVYTLGKQIQAGEKRYTLLAEADATSLFNIIQRSDQLGETGESFIVYAQKEKIILASPLKKQQQQDIYAEDLTHAYYMWAIKGQQATGYQTDYAGDRVLASWAEIPNLGMGIITKIDESEVYNNSTRLIWQFIAAGIAVIIIALIITTIFSKFLTQALHRLRVTLQLVGSGVLPEKIDQEGKDEIGLMAEDVSHLVSGLKRTAQFAHKIGKGQFDVDYEPLSDKDSLGNSLINMRDNIQEAEARDKERNRIVHGLAEISEILRSHDELDVLGDEIVQFVCAKINAIQGAFYTIEKEDDQDDIRKSTIAMRASYAYNRKKYLKSTFKFAEGLVGQAAAEKDIVLRTEIPYDYVTVTSGLLGDQRPTCILVVPLITEEEVYGVVEFAGFERFSPSDVKFVQEISVIIARTISNIKVNATTRRLLDESRKMSNELQEKQEILQQNAEEMQATQEELQRTNQQLEEQIDEVNRGQRQMQLLLENASEVITIYDRNGNIKYVSPSVTKIFGYKPEELEGTNDSGKVLEHYRAALQQEFTNLINNANEAVNLQFEYRKKDGEAIWLEATGNNHLNDPAIAGLLFNYRDITERKRAEQEERMRSKMQSLSENSPDLITRFNQDGKVFYINPTIEQYTDKTPEDFTEKSFEEAEIPENITSKYNEIIADVMEIGAQKAVEINFPSDKMGERIMQLRGIPEFDEEENIESVLVVSHDITERKLIELEVKNQNKKITESINYAKRIQWAIVPDEQVIEKHLPDSMIFYKAKDVVSGDFPWYAEVGDDVYLAAVDCTGHGVPGALISLIGYFLLNDIVKSQKISDPGKILDMLDAGVTETLKQERGDSMSKDGMDLALVKINKKTNKVSFAGAHRSLYFVNQGTLEEIKGNKFAIGGGRYRNQTDFTTHELEMQKDDLIVFCSDGFPDQFGGPLNRKFGPKRLRELIQTNHNLPMKEMQKVFEGAWVDWKADYKQTDDVLLMAIRF
ncbi:PAS domain S-box protein [Persicobacter sp. CCB-QB2]|uniref:PAS domain S-box protein n=1 Tax=Persicobacter sp. CCB-QB2 TaxID=1561025 RepID=UPI0006A986C7|nr:PAS domain S-box protein [Persicobacter sp. CCB-QB2]